MKYLRFLVRNVNQILDLVRGFNLKHFLQYFDVPESELQWYLMYLEALTFSFLLSSYSCLFPCNERTATDDVITLLRIHSTYFIGTNSTSNSETIHLMLSFIIRLRSQNSWENRSVS
jgi:hypothetical protein